MRDKSRVSTHSFADICVVFCSFSEVVPSPIHPTAPARAAPVSFFERYHGGIAGTDEEGNLLPVIYYMGIIDILQPYNLSKKAESKLKLYAPFFRIPREQLSAVGPHLYARRFQDFLIARVGPGKAKYLRDEAHKGGVGKLRLSRQRQEVQDEVESDRLVRAVTGFDKDALLKELAHMEEMRPPPAAAVPVYPLEGGASGGVGQVTMLGTGLVEDDGAGALSSTRTSRSGSSSSSSARHSSVIEDSAPVARAVTFGGVGEGGQDDVDSFDALM